MTTVAVDLPAVVRKPVESLLESMGIGWCDLASGRQPPLAILRMAEAAGLDAEPTVPVIHLWRRGRHPIAGNPFRDPRVRSVLSASPVLDEHALRSTLQQLRSRSYLRLDDLLSEDRLVHSSTHHRLDERDDLERRLEQFCARIGGVRPHVTADLQVALSELYTNAIRRAPVERGEHLYSAVSAPGAIQSRLPVTVSFGFDGQHVGISVHDQYGSLWPDEVLDHLYRCYQRQLVEIEREEVGLGFFFLLQAASRLVVNLNPGKFSEVIFFRRVTESRREFLRGSPTFQLCIDADDLVATRRRERRAWVKWLAYLEDRPQAPIAEVLDVSPAGAFLSGTPWVETVEVGTKLKLRLTSPTNVSSASVPATVRWKGRSRAHRCTGVGVEFASPILAVSEWLAQPHKVKAAVIEHSASVYESLQQALARANTRIELEWFSTYEEGIEQIARGEHDVYLVGDHFGEWTGIQLLREAMATGRDVPVVYLSGKPDADDELRATMAGAVDCVSTDSFDSAVLSTAIRHAIDRKRAESRIARLRRRIDELEEHVLRVEQYDRLTALPNRRLFDERLSHALLRMKRHPRRVTIALISLNELTSVNDSLGREIGDRLIKEVSSQLVRAVREEDTVARFGGKDFAILFEGTESESDARALVARLEEALARTFTFRGEDILLTVSIGVTMYPGEQQDEKELVENAELGLVRAKELGKNVSQFYTRDLRRRVADQLALERRIRQALEREEFDVFYQPIMSVQPPRVVGMEALVRLRKPDGRGWIAPDEFIPVAEESNLILAIDEWVARTACQQHREWEKLGFTDLRLSVNCSARHFRQRGLAPRIAGVLEDTGIDPANLQIELTESVLLDDADLAAEILARLKALGVRLALDDFGVGYSSLSYMKRFPFDTIKIDRSFMHDLTSTGENAAIVNAIIALTRALELEVVAEGIETAEQRDFLELQGCHRMQGYLFCRPVAADAFVELLRKDRGGGAQ